MNRIEVRIVWLALGILGGALVVLFTSGCSTIKGIATDMYAASEAIGGAARDDD